MRIRFRASDFGLVAKININFRAKSKQASCPEMVLGSFFFVRVVQQLGFWTEKIQANVDYCYVRRRAECNRSALDSSIQTYAQTLVWPRRDVPTCFTLCFFSTKHPSPARELLLCVYSRMIRSHERRALGALLSLFSRSEPASTYS